MKRTITLLLVAMLLFAVPVAIHAKIYKWVDENGVTRYSQTRPSAAQVAPERVTSPRIREAAAADAAQRPANFCVDLSEVAGKLTVHMHRGMDYGSLWAWAEANAPDALGIINYVVSFRDTKITPGRVQGLVASQCRTGTYDHIWKKRIAQPDGFDAYAAYGTGWVIGPRHIATSQHVIEGKATVKVIQPSGQALSARVVAEDEPTDVAILEIDEGASLPPPLIVSRHPVAMGTAVFTIGYPHLDVMGRSPKLTHGVISATTGYQDNENQYQISVPVQSGNSGGPLLNMQGEVVGIVAAKLNAAALYNSRGDITQNVNYAIKSPLILKVFEQVRDDDDVPVQRTQARVGELDQLAARVQQSVVIVEAR